MNENKILHVMILSNFLAPFIDFVDENFGRDNHHYVFITSEKYDYGLTPEHKVEFLHTDDDIFITLLKYMKMAKKIILHGLWRDKINILLYFNQELLKKCYWFTWGGDFYFPEKQSLIKKKIIKKMGVLVAYIQEEADLIRKWYGATGEYYSCFKYPSNIFIEKEVKKVTSNTINILIGNSATITNNHIDIINTLSKYKSENIKIYAPLSYGDKEYANMVVNYGTNILEDKFSPILDFIGLDEYLDLLSKIDIAVFAHKRQQAMGNTVSLLGMGKKVYLYKDTSISNFFNKIDVKIFDIEDFNLDLIDQEDSKKNKKVILELFSKETLAIQLNSLF